MKRDCGRCFRQPPPFAAALCLGAYHADLRRAILRTKYPHGRALARALALWLAHERAVELQAWQADLVVPIPLHWSRRLLRGYNNTEVMGRALARQLQIPYEPRLLRQVRRTELNTRLSATQRIKNVRGAFGVRTHAPLKGCKVLLVDDVLTTGATCSEATRRLLQAGAREVVVAVWGRTMSL